MTPPSRCVVTAPQPAETRFFGFLHSKPSLWGTMILVLFKPCAFYFFSLLSWALPGPLAQGRADSVGADTGPPSRAVKRSRLHCFTMLLLTKETSKPAEKFYELI